LRAWGLWRSKGRLAQLSLAIAARTGRGNGKFGTLMLMWPAISEISSDCSYLGIAALSEMA
jgi:hypothetical protein